MEDSLYPLLMNSALRYVSLRPRSEKEMRDFISKKILKFKITGQGMLDRVMGRLKELEYVDDRKFVEWWVRSRAANKPKGKRMLSLELSGKGVPRDIIEEVFASSFQASMSEVQQAKKAVERKMLLWGTLPKPEQKKKLSDFLMRRGFDYDVVRQAVDEMLTSAV